MLSSWPLMLPLSGKRASALLMVLSCCFLSWSSRLCSKSVEADRGSPSLTRTTNANRIRDMICWVHEEHTACIEKKNILLFNYYNLAVNSLNQPIKFNHQKKIIKSGLKYCCIENNWKQEKTDNYLIHCATSSVIWVIILNANGTQTGYAVQKKKALCQLTRYTQLNVKVCARTDKSTLS